MFLLFKTIFSYYLLFPVKNVFNNLNNEEYLRRISLHIPKHSKPIKDVDFGHYLAGLIDGNDHFSSAKQLIIVFHINDISLAYYIKKKE